MIFLIEYDRRSGKLVTFRKFAGSQKEPADKLRLQLELDLNRRAVEHEVVVLEAPDENALRRTHRRYFEKLGTLVEPGLA